MGAVVLSLVLTGCSGSFEFGRPPAPKIIPPAGATTIVAPDGEEVIETAPIDTVLRGLSQAQTTRTLVRQLAR